MLKKITVSSILILLIALVVAIAALPVAIRDFLHNGDKILSGVFNSTPVSSFDSAQYDAIHIDMSNTNIFLEQSSDDKIYMRVEGLFADRYNIATEDMAVEDQRVLNIRFDNEDLFFDSNISSYLMRRALMEGTYSAIILRIPSTVSVTTKYPYLVDYDNTVQFVNRDYYVNREWRKEDEMLWAQTEAMNESVEHMREQFFSQRESLISEMDAAIARPYTSSEPSIEDLDAEIDEIATKYSQNLNARLFPYSPMNHDIETLRTLLQNYIDLAAAYKKQAARLENYYDKEENEAFEITESCDRLEQLTHNALENFTSLYNSYLSASLEELSQVLPTSEELETKEKQASSVPTGTSDASSETSSEAGSDAGTISSSSLSSEPAAASSAVG